MHQKHVVRVADTYTTKQPFLSGRSYAKLPTRQISFLIGNLIKIELFATVRCSAIWMHFCVLNIQRRLYLSGAI